MVKIKAKYYKKDILVYCHHKDPTLLTLFINQNFISAEDLANQIGIKVEKILQDKEKGYLRGLILNNEPKPDLIYKDIFLERYKKERGNTKKLTTFGYSLDSFNNVQFWYGYFVKFKETSSGRCYAYLYAPDKSVIEIKEKDMRSAYIKARNYVFKNQFYAPSPDDHLNQTLVPLGIDEIYFLLSIINTFELPHLYRKLAIARDLILIKKKDNKLKKGGKNGNQLTSPIE
jgi:hypothetical protein